MEAPLDALAERRSARDVSATLRAIYEDVLEAEGVDANASFFVLGGSSLLVVMLLESVGERLGVHVPPETFYRTPTLTGLQQAVEERRQADVNETGQPDLAALVTEAAATGPDRPAVVAPDGTISYQEIVDLLSAGAERANAPSEPVKLRLPTSVAGVRTMLEHLAARRPALVLAPDATDVEEDAAWRAFLTHLSQQDETALHAVATSGSTGRPKVVLTPYDGMLEVQRAHAGVYGLRHDDTYLVMAPLHFGFGFRAGVLVGLLSGATVVLPSQPLSPQSLRACADRHRVTMTMGVSFAYRILLASDAPLPSLRVALVGGDPLPSALVRAWQERTAVPLTDSYGTSETDHVSDNVDAVPGSVGTPLPCVEVRVRDHDGSMTETGVGELLVRSPGLARGYAGDPERTAEKFRDGWCHTGDVAQLTEDGHIFLRGRLDDRINVSGAMVDAAEIEEACREVPGVQDCAVVGVPGGSGIVEVRAYIVAGRQVTRTDLARALAGRLSPHKIPSRVVQLDSLPRGAGGKVARAELPR